MGGNWKALKLRDPKSTLILSKRNKSNNRSYLRDSQFVSVTCWKGLSILPGYGLLVGIYATHFTTGVLML
jgi:hypothetical protein